MNPETKDLIGCVVGLVFVAYVLVMLTHYYWTELRRRPSPNANAKVKFVTRDELPPILAELIDAYLNASNDSFSFRWSLETKGVLRSVARCYACGALNRLAEKGVEGAHCAKCGIPLERYPKPKRSERTTN